MADGFRVLNPAVSGRPAFPPAIADNVVQFKLSLAEQSQNPQRVPGGGHGRG